MKFASLKLFSKSYYPFVITALFLILAVGLLLCLKPKSIQAITLKTTIGPNIVLDAGHGGFDGGATSVYGVLEKDINLSIALKTERFLKLLGFNVVMTRKTDEALAPTKKEDMYKRLEIIKNTPDCVFVSIHQNKFSQSKYYGAQMFYGSNNEEDSRALSLVLQKNFKSNIDNDNLRQVKPVENSLFLFKKSPVTAVLVECGFLSNYNEAKLLNNNEYQNKIAFTIAQSIAEFFANNSIERDF